MTIAEQNAADLLATRVAGGLNQMTAEQRVRVLCLLHAQFCATCGVEPPKCRCFDLGEK